MGEVLGSRTASLLVAFAAAGCVQTATLTCEGDALCPSGTSCLALGAQQLCVTDEQRAACAGSADGEACEIKTGAGTSYGGACLPAGCGNGRLDTGESCDDGNNTLGDGCSADCRSTEVCGNGLVDPVRILDTGDPTTPIDDVVAANEACDDNNLVGHDGCDSQCELETPRWEVIAYHPVLDRFEHAMVFDAAREQVLMFGGSSYGGAATDPGKQSSDTLELGDDQWLHHTPAVHPASRQAHAMAYDARRQRTVLFGGTNNSHPAADTWEWDGSSWSLMQPLTSPPAKGDHAMAYDADRGVVVLFGGRDAIDSTGSSETWEWDGVRWRQRTDVGAPPGRYRQVMAYDPNRGVIVMTGGATQVDTWEYDGQQWRDVTPSGSSTIALNAAMAYDAVDRRMILQGGSTSDPQTRAWDGARWTSLAASPGLGPRKSIRATTDATGRPIAMGGLAYDATVPGTPQADTWRWNGTIWVQLVAPQPGNRAGAAALDRHRARVVLVGGLDAQTWELGVGGWRQIVSTMTPPFRQLHTLTYDAARRRIVMFGGTAGDPQTWTLDGDEWSVAATTGPPGGLRSAAMTFDDEHDVVVMFGGVIGGSEQNATWLWDGAAWSQPALTTLPPPRRFHALAYDPIRKRVILFGGLSESGLPMSDTWAWDGAAWTELHPANVPIPRSAHGLAWDATRRRLVLAGGGGDVDDVWEWDGSNWQQVLAPAPGTLGQSMVSAIDGAGVLVISTFGGSTGAWRLRWSGNLPYEACFGGDHDADGLAGCADRDCWATCSPLCPPGVSCLTTGPYTCGDGACDPDLESCSSCPTDCTCTPMCGDFRCDAGETCPGDC